MEQRNLRVSQQVLEWQAITQRANLLRLLQRRFKAPVPSDLVEMIQEVKDMELLSRWFDAAVEAKILDDFRAATQPQG